MARVADTVASASPADPILEPLPSLPPPGPAILFTAFEPSGDDHASEVIRELRRRHPHLVMYAWGGPKMHKAGAIVVERTGDDAVVGLPGVAKIIEHYRITKRIDRWIGEHAREAGVDNPVVLHVPVDSPAANGPICKLAKAHGLKVCHLVAPQIWAWGRWRINTLRRITDQLLCILPFEEGFFRARNVPATFIGHFLFDRELNLPQLDMRAAMFGEGSPRIAMMPGSRPHEVRKHFPILLDAFHAIQAAKPNAVGVVASTGDAISNLLRQIGQVHPRGWPEALRVVVQDTDAVVRWCDLALVKSGTVTLQVAKQAKPMVIFYKRSNPLLFLIARTFLTTRHFALPNLLADGRIIPELVPHFGGHEPIAQIALRLLDDPAEVQQQQQAMHRIAATFAGKHAAALAADHIERMAGLVRPAMTHDSQT